MQHESLIAKAYTQWTPDLSYRALLCQLNVTERRAVVLGNLNYQVQHGGFSQWALNRYDDGADFLQEALQAVGTKTAQSVLGLVNEALKVLTDMEGTSEDDGMYTYLDQLDNRYYRLSAQLMFDAENFFKGPCSVPGPTYIIAEHAALRQCPQTTG